MRNSLVFEVDDRNLIIAQTNPPIGKNYLNKTLVLTYMAKGKKNPTRYAFDAAILKFLSDYRLSEGKAAQAIVLSRKSAPANFNLRFFFRVESPSSFGLNMRVHGRSVNVLDVSIGGIRIGHDGSLKFETGNVVPLSLSIDGDIFEVNGVVKRTWPPEEARMFKNLEFAALEFVEADSHLKSTLGRKIFEIQRVSRLREIS